jgi:hypothetical protein
MSSSYTTNLKIQQIGNGEQAGVWGSSTNTNWTLIEQAVAGVQTITMANANYTLSNLNGVSDEARNMVLNIVGTNSGVYQVIIPANQTKFYIVSNNTTGGYAITIGTTGVGGSVVSIPNGTTAQVYTDGTNTYSAQTGSAGDFKVNGNFTVTGNQTDTGNLTVSGTFTANNGASFAVSPTAPTPTVGDNTTKVATTAFVTAATSGLGTMAQQNANAVAITGGTISGATVTGATVTGATISSSTIPNSNVTGLGSLATQSSVTAAQLPSGVSLQTQYFQYTSGNRVSGGTWTDTGITVNITPVSASNKVLVKTDISWSSTDGTPVQFRLLRNGTSIGEGTSGSIKTVGQDSFVRGGILSTSFEYLDSPATTSAVTYKIQAYSPAGEWTINICQFSGGALNGYYSTSSISAQEIKG